MAGDGHAEVLRRTRRHHTFPVVKRSSRPVQQPVPISVVGLHIGVVGTFLLLSTIIWAHVWFTGHPTHTISLSLGDPAEETWWFAWLPWAILHGHNPFFTTALYAGRGGVNTLANVSVMFPALVLSPVTLLFGPIAAFNVAGTLSPVISGYCMFLLTRKFTHFPPAQILAGALWGFSPTVIDNLPYGHLVDVLGFFLPLAGLLIYDVVIEHKRLPWIDGVLLGLLVIAQFFTSTEPLAIIALCAPVAAAVGLVLARDVLWETRRALRTTSVWAIAFAGVVLAYPTWFAVAGPRHIVGPPWPFDLTDPLSGYLGWSVLIFIGVSLPVWRTRRLAWCAAWTGLWAWMLSWGVPDHRVLGGSGMGPHPTLVWPWALFQHLPLFANIQTFRFGAVVAFCAAVLLAISLDQWWQLAKRKGVRLRVAIGFGATIAALGSLVPVAPSDTIPLAIHSSPTPPWFTHEASRLPEGSTVLTVPFTVVQPLSSQHRLQLLGTEVMTYQAEESLRFSLIGGYVLAPGKGGASVWRRPLGGTAAILTRLSEPAFPLPTPSSKSIAEFRASLHRWDVQVTVILRPHLYRSAVTYLAAVYGRAPIEQRGALAWYGNVDP